MVPTNDKPVVLSKSAGDFSDVSNAEVLVQALHTKLADAKVTPDLIVQISDLRSPGGVVIGSELQGRFVPTPSLITAKVFLRDSYDDVQILGSPSTPAVKSILIVDDVIFSGTTVMNTADKISKLYPSSKIYVAALVRHTSAPNLEEMIGIENIFYSSVTSNREVLFPWGAAEWYGDLTLDFGETDFNIHTSKRPWGHYEDFAHNRKCTVRIHTLLPDSKMSLQRHKLRDEFFLPLDNGISYTLGDTEDIKTVPGDYAFVPRGQWHRLINQGSKAARVLEVAFGEYDQINDIERKADDYDRVGSDGST